MGKQKERKQETPPLTQTEEKTVRTLNDYAEITIGGVTYRVKSVFADKGQMGDLLDLAAMEKSAGLRKGPLHQSEYVL